MERVRHLHLHQSPNTDRAERGWNVSVTSISTNHQTQTEPREDGTCPSPPSPPITKHRQSRERMERVRHLHLHQSPNTDRAERGWNVSVTSISTNHQTQTEPREDGTCPSPPSPPITKHRQSRERMERVRHLHLHQSPNTDRAERGWNVSVTSISTNHQTQTEPREDGTCPSPPSPPITDLTFICDK